MRKVKTDKVFAAQTRNTVPRSIMNYGIDIVVGFFLRLLASNIKIYFSLLIWGKKHKWQPEIRNLQPSSRYVQNVYLCEWHWIYGEDLNKTKDIWTNKSAAMCLYSSIFVVHL